MPSAPPVPSDSGESADRPRRRLWIALAAVIAAVVALRVALPYAIPPLVGWLAMRQVGLDARIQNVDLEVFKGTVAVEGLWVGPPGVVPEDAEVPDPATALLALDRVSLDLAWTELVNGRVNLRAVRVDAPRVRVERLANGRIDPMHGATPPLPDPEAEAKAAAEEATAEPAAAEAGAAVEAPAGQGGGWPIVVDDLAVRGAEVRVVEEADGEELLDFQLAELDLMAFSMDGASIGLGGIGVRQPEIRVKREFLLDPTKSAGRPPAPPEEVAAEDPAAPGRARGYRIDNLDIERAVFQLLVGERVVDVALAVKADGVTLDRRATFPLEIHLEVGDSGSLDIQGEAGAVPPHFVGTVKSDDLPMHLTLLALREDFNDWVKRFRIDSDLDVAFHSLEHDGNRAGLVTNGRVAVAGFDVSDPQGDDLAVSWDELEILLHEVAVPVGDAATTTPMRVHVEKVSLVAPKMRYRQPSDALERLLSGPIANGAAEDEAEPVVEVETAEAPGGPPPEILVDRVEIENGQVDFHDGNVQPAFDAQVARFRAVIDGIDAGAPSARKIDLDILLGDGTTLKGDGHLGATDGDLKLLIKRLRLPQVNPYANAAGIAVENGALTVKTDISAKGTHWKVDSDVTLHDLRLDPEGSKEFIDSLGMPLDLILSLLRDPTGDIDLPVALEFDEGKMETGVAGLIAGALRQALVGAATIPLKALGGVFGRGGGFELEPIPSVPGVVAAADQTAERGLAMAGLLKERPELAILLTGRAGEEDHPFLQRAVLTEGVAEGGDLPELDEGAGLIGRQQIKSALKKRAKGGEGELSPENEAFLQRYFDASEVPDERYDRLARARADSIRGWLVDKQGVNPARVLVADEPKRGDPGIVLDLESLTPSEDEGA